MEAQQRSQGLYYSVPNNYVGEVLNIQNLKAEHLDQHDDRILRDPKLPIHNSSVIADHERASSYNFSDQQEVFAVLLL